MNSTNPAPSQTAANLKLHKILRRLIQERGWTVSHFCRTARLPRQTIHNWLSGQTPGDFEMVKRAADALGVTLDELCFGVAEKVPRDKKYEAKLPGMPLDDDDMKFEVVVRRIR